MAHVYVSGHRHPDTDSVAAAIGYAELKRRLDPRTDYVPVRLGELNPQTSWLVERAGIEPPQFLPHILLRVCDVMRESFPVARWDEPVRKVGLTMAEQGLDLVPVVDDDGALVGAVTERALARRYVRESREASRLDAPTAVQAIVDVLEGKLLAGDPAARIEARVWVIAMEVGALPRIGAGDVAVVGNRVDAQRRLIDLGVAVLVVTNGNAPPDDVLAEARERGIAVISSPLDSYVTARFVTLAAPCSALMESEPLSVRREDLMSDIADEVKDIHYRAAVAVDGARRPVGLVTRSDLVGAARRRVVLVDHAELAQSVPGVEQAEIVEILDHHHIGSIETITPVAATFDPVGSTATLVIERFRQNGLEPSPPTATMLLGGILSDTVILNSPTTTERDLAAVEYLERVLAIDARELGREMFEATSDVSRLPASEIVTRDVKDYEAGGKTLSIAQIETVGATLLDRVDELRDALEAERERDDRRLYALMVTDIMAKGTRLLAAGDLSLVERAFDARIEDGGLDLPGVMSRKKQVAPKLLAAVF